MNTHLHSVQAGWFYGPIAPPVLNAPSSECPRASIAARRRATISIRISRRASCCCSRAIAGIVRRGKLQNLSPPSVLFESSPNFFAIYRRHRCKKWCTRILTFEFCDFWEFFEIFKKVLRGLRLIWTIMVAAKLDQSRVLVTKFHQNRLTLKGRSASQRHSDRQTDRQTDKLGLK